MSKSLIVLGRQPSLGLAELESLIVASKIEPLNDGALIDIDTQQIPFTRLGGSIKLAAVINQLNTFDFKQIESYLEKFLSEEVAKLPDGKITLGLSAYGLTIKPNDLERSALSLKKVLSKKRSVRVVPNKKTDLSSAQVLHNKLADQFGFEIIIFKTSSGIVLARTTAVQDIEAYAARDQARPKRDARVGMLPPKLAQIIINLANPASGSSVLDPFCGSGVILQEALLIGFKVYGSDLDPRMIEYSEANLKWMGFEPSKWQLAVADATKAQWDTAFDAVASETYLGQPYSTLPPTDQLNKNINYVNQLQEKFLHNIALQTKSGLRLSLAVPAWKTPSGFKHLPVIDHLKELGYNRLSFVHVKNEDLVYHREDQIVARELLVLNRK